MAGQTTSVNYNNIIMGPCSSFTVDDTEIGGTSGGVQFSKKRTHVEIEVDQLIGTAKLGIKKDAYTCKTTMSEATLQNLAIAWDAAAPTVDATANTTTLGIGVDTQVRERVLTFVGPAPSATGGAAKTRTFTLHRAVSMASSEVGMSKDKETVFTVEFTCLPDTTQPDGQQYGTVVDA